MKLRFLFIVIASVLLFGSCRVVNFSDIPQHKHLRKVPVETPDAVINNIKADITPDHAPDMAKLNADEEANMSIETERNLSADAEENYKRDKKPVFQTPAKFLNIYSSAPKASANIAADEDSYIDPVTILIWALIIVLFLALLAVLVPQILDLIIGLLIVVLIVVLILYLASNL